MYGILLHGANIIYLTNLCQFNSAFQRCCFYSFSSINNGFIIFDRDISITEEF